MNTILKTSAAALLAASIMPAGAQTVATGCRVDLSTAEKAIGDRRDMYGPSAPDFRDLRDAANILSRYGKNDACQAVVNAINEMAAAPPTYIPPGGAVAPRTGVNPPATANPAPAANSPSFQYDRMAAVREARPVSDGNVMVSSYNLMGSTVYSATDGRSLGEIEDVVLGAAAKDSFAVVGYGGFLGIGEKKVRIPLSDLMVNEAYNTYYVKLDDAQLKAAPGLRKVEGRWVEASR